MQFGVFENGSYLIPAYWQSLWNAIPQLTTGLGAWISGPVSDRYGRRFTMFMAGVLSIIGVAIVYTAENSPQFLVGKMINSLGLGAALASGQTYVSEITPTKIRGIALAVYTVCLVCNYSPANFLHDDHRVSLTWCLQSVGYLIAASVAFTRVTIMNDSSYKVLFAAEWSWPGILVLFAFLVPESPYFYIRKGKADAAGKALGRLHRGWTSEAIQSHIQRIQHATTHENEADATRESSFRDCFRGNNWRRTRIVLYANGLSQMVGATFINNAPYFMVLAGLSSTDTAMMVEIGIAMSIFSSVLTLWAMARVGRRPIVLSGIALAAVLFFVMGVAASLPPPQSPAALWCVAVTLQMVWLSIGPANGPALSVAAEVGSIRLRAKTLAVGFFFNYFWSMVWNLVVPYMFNAGYGDLGGLMGWIFFGTSVISFVVMWLELPETKDLSFEQIDRRFEMKVKARCFSSAKVDERSHDKGQEVELGEVEQVEDAKR